jgi:hypothetical protein
MGLVESQTQYGEIRWVPQVCVGFDLRYKPFGDDLEINRGLYDKMVRFECVECTVASYHLLS